MPFFKLLLAAPLLLSAISAHPLVSRASKPCFITGTVALPAEVQTVVDNIQSSITCSSKIKTIGSIPDVTSGSTSFSSINFADSSLSPLKFALQTFATTEPLAKNDLGLFEDNLNVYLATEAALRSEGGSLAIKGPKFFLAFQIARIKTAKGIAITDPGQTVEHLHQKVISNSPGVDQATLDLIAALAILLS